MLRTQRPVLVALGLCTAVAAQEPAAVRPLPAATGGFFANVGVDRQADGSVFGTGPAFDARFTADEVRYTPVLGKAAPRDLPLAYRLQAVGRGAAAHPIGPATLSVDGNTVTCRHDVVAATYELRTAGLKQSFVFASLPAGDGDLVVRGTVDTELRAGEIGADGIAFTLPGAGGVRIGAVLGVDANGKQTAGTMRRIGDLLEFALPDAFVDAAALPIVVDPLISSVVTLGGANDDLVPDIAYDASTDTYLVVWQRDLSLLNQDLRGQRVRGDGTLIGGTLVIENASTTGSQVCVANVNLRNAFIVAWVQGSDILARGVDSATGTLSAQVTVAGTADTETQPDIAGEVNDSIDDDALCVWANTTNGDIEAKQIAYSSSGTLVVGNLISFANPLFSTYGNPSISQNGGGGGSHLICWESFGSLSSTTSVRGTVVDRNLGTIVAPFTIVSSGSLSMTDPDVDGDGDALHWVVAYEREETAGSADHDVYAVPVHLDNAAAPVIGAEVGVDTGASDDERDPAVCWHQDACLVAWSDEASAGNYDTYVVTIDPLQCTTCEGRYNLDTATTTSASFPAMAWRNTTTGADNLGAMIVWQSFDIAGSTGDIATVRFEGGDGFAQPAADGCSLGGAADGWLCAKCARSPNLNFRIEQRRVSAGMGSTILVLSPARADLPLFASCALAPDPWLGFTTGILALSPGGDVFVDLPIPSGVAGAALYAQWLNIGISASLSNAVRIHVQ